MAVRKPADPRGGHCRIYWEIIDSMAWRALDWTARGLYVEMRRKLQSTNNGNIEATLGTLRHAGFRSAATLAKGLRSLQTIGLITMTRQGGIAVGKKSCSLYRFTDEATFEHPKLGVKASPAGNEWKRFATLAEARAALAAAHKAAKRDPDQNTSGLQKLNRVDSKNEASAQILDSVSEQEGSSRVQKLKQCAGHENPAKPHAAWVSGLLVEKALPALSASEIECLCMLPPYAVAAAEMCAHWTPVPMMLGGVAA